MNTENMKIKTNLNIIVYFNNIIINYKYNKLYY